MSYSIIRMQKMKSPAIKGIQFHNQRERESETNPDINKSISYLNYDLMHHQSKIDYNEKIDRVIQENVTPGKTIRKDAVKLAEFLITSDKEFFDGISPKDQKRYFQNAYEFLADRYGKQNLIYATVHYDEKTPHMHVGFVPVTEDGRLSAKDFFGQRNQLVSLQDDFNAHIKKNGFNLERGVSSSRKHLETAKFKALTLEKRQKEANENYEYAVNRIEKISKSTKSIENIQSKKVLGLVGMKEDDYNNLVDYAMNGIVYQQKAEDLEKELNKSNAAFEKLRADVQLGQDKLRLHYKDIEDNLEYLAERKSLEKLKRHDLVKDYSELIEKYNVLANKFNDQLNDKKELKQQFDTLRFENLSYQNENRELKSENNKLKEKFVKISKDFSALKERLEGIFNDQLDRVKTFLRISNVSPEKINILDNKREKIIQESLDQVDGKQTNKRERFEIER